LDAHSPRLRAGSGLPYEALSAVDVGRFTTHTNFGAHSLDKVARRHPGLDPCDLRAERAHERSMTDDQAAYRV
jgi:hypothetical protein